MKMHGWFATLTVPFLLAVTLEAQVPDAESGRLELVGGGTSGSAGTPILEGRGAPWIDARFSTAISRARAGAAGVLVVGPLGASVYLPSYDATLYVLPPYLVENFVVDDTGEAGPLTLLDPVPPELSLASYVVQAGVLDPGATGGIAFTAGLRVRFGGRRATALFPSPHYPTGDRPYGSAVADFDADGALDLATINYGSDDLTLRFAAFGPELGATVTMPVGNAPTSLTVADVNVDGRVDLVVGRSETPRLLVLPGLGDGTFGPAITFDTPSTPQEIVILDFDRDGELDAVLTAGGVTVHSGIEDGSSPHPASYPAGGAIEGMAVVDLDGNGALDILAATNADQLAFLRGSRFGTLEMPVVTPVAGGVQDLAVADFDGDGHLDAAVVCRPVQRTRVYMYHGDGRGGFVAGVWFNIAVGLRGRVETGDLNEDGIADLVLADDTGSTVLVAVGYGDGSFADCVPYSVGRNPRSLLLRDLDGDDVLDLLVTEELTDGVTLLHGAGDGTFRQSPVAAASRPMCAVIEDFDRDGMYDLAVGNDTDDTVTLYRGQEDGSLAAGGEWATSCSASRITAADFDGDGHVDFAVVGSSDSMVAVCLGGGDGTFDLSRLSAGTTGTGSLVEFAVADLNGDDVLDVVTTQGGPTDGAASLLGLGDGYFSAPVHFTPGPHPKGVALGDLNGDLLIDAVFATRYAGTVCVQLGLGTGAFAPAVEYPVAPTGLDHVVVDDFDGDGFLDVVAAHSWSGIYLLRGTGSGGLGTPELLLAEQGGPLAVGDLNGDTFLDLAAADRGDGLMWVLPGRGNGTFGEALAFATGDQPEGIAIGDLDRAGFADFALPRLGAGEVRLLLNRLAD